MRLLFAYGKERFFVLLLLIAWWLLYAVVFALYRLNLEAVLYAAVLGAVGTLTVAAVDFGLWLRRLRTLRELQNRVTLGLDGLPEPYGATEGAYQELLRSLYADRLTQLGAAGAREKDMVDYYTLWAHQIKTPIAAMRLLLQEEPRPELEGELLKIEQYVEMVLGYLRLGSDSTDYVFRDCDLDSLIRQSVRKYARLFILKKISLYFQATGKTVLTDGKWLSFVIEQLLSNAVKYTPEGGGVRIYGDGETLVIADSGIGIQPEDLPRVFEKGFTGFNGREDKKSTGIGLYLCRQVLDRLNHDISISSRPGQGTLVRLDLSRRKREVE